jgi:hypothetical protein
LPEKPTLEPRRRGPPDGRMRVLVANEPRSYREAIAFALLQAGQALEVFLVEPENLDREAARLVPQVVICSHATLVVRDLAVTYIELYPDHGPLSYICIDGEHSEVDGIDFSGLLAIVSRTGGVIAAARQSGPHRGPSLKQTQEGGTDAS